MGGERVFLKKIDQVTTTTRFICINYLDVALFIYLDIGISKITKIWFIPTNVCILLLLLWQYCWGSLLGRKWLSQTFLALQGQEWLRWESFPCLWLASCVILARSVFLFGLSFCSPKMGELNLISKFSNSSKIQGVGSEALVRSKALELKLLQQVWRRARSQSWVLLKGQTILLPSSGERQAGLLALTERSGALHTATSPPPEPQLRVSR